jgi:hypothetical protein
LNAGSSVKVIPRVNRIVQVFPPSVISTGAAAVNGVSLGGEAR